MDGVRIECQEVVRPTDREKISRSGAQKERQQDERAVASLNGGSGRQGVPRAEQAYDGHGRRRRSGNGRDGSEALAEEVEATGGRQRDVEESQGTPQVAPQAPDGPGRQRLVDAELEKACPVLLRERPPVGGVLERREEAV